MGWETKFVVFEPKTGPEIYDQLKTIDVKIAAISANEDDFYWKLTKEIWAVFKSSLLNGTLEIQDRNDNSVCPAKVHGFLSVLDRYYHGITSTYLFEYEYSDYKLVDIFNGSQIGRWGKACWVLNAPFGEDSEVSNEALISNENFSSIDILALEVCLSSDILWDRLSNIPRLSKQQIQLFLYNDHPNCILLGLDEFPEPFLKLENLQIQFTKPINISVEIAEKILSNKAWQFQFPYGSSNAEAMEVLDKLKIKQSLNLDELQSVELKMNEHFREIFNEQNKEKVESADGEYAFARLISEEGADWIDDQREIPVNYIASDAIERVKKLGLSFLYEVIKEQVPRSNRKLTLLDAISFYSRERWGALYLLDSNKFEIIENYYHQLIEQLEETGEFQIDASSRFGGISKEEYCDRKADPDYNDTASRDEEFLNSAKAALKEGKPVYFYTD